MVVVADACTDQTAGLARAGGAAVLDIGARSVGAARAAGLAEVLRRTGPLDPASVWLATTDADTLVPPCWLTRQLRYAEGGWDAVVGTVTVTDWRQYPAAVPPLFQASGTGRAGRPTRTCTGPTWASARPRTWPRAGSGRPRPPRTTPWSARSPPPGRQVLRTTTVSVVTSARRRARAPHGFSHLLAGLAAPAEA